MLVLDSHIDTPSQIFRGRNIALDNSFGHVDFPTLSRGGVDGSFFALYTPPGVAPDAATRYALELLACVQDTVEENAWQCAFAFSPEEDTPAASMPHQIPEEIKHLEFSRFQFDVPETGAITFKIWFDEGILPETWPATRERKSRTSPEPKPEQKEMETGKEDPVR